LGSFKTNSRGNLGEFTANDGVQYDYEYVNVENIIQFINNACKKVRGEKWLTLEYMTSLRKSILGRPGAPGMKPTIALYTWAPNRVEKYIEILSNPNQGFPSIQIYQDAQVFLLLSDDADAQYKGTWEIKGQDAFANFDKFKGQKRFTPLELIKFEPLKQINPKLK
jgi:hypothetical protein